MPLCCTKEFARWQVAPERHPLTSAKRTRPTARNHRDKRITELDDARPRIWPRAESLDCRDRDPPGLAASSGQSCY